MLQTKQAVVLSDEHIRKVAPSVFALAPHESRTERYTPIPTINIVKGLREIGYFVTYAQQTNARQGHELFTKHFLRFRSEQHLGPHALQAEYPEIGLVNSFDGTSSYKLLFCVYRLVCTNGLISGRTEDTIGVQHRGGPRIVSMVVDATLNLAAHVEPRMALIEEMKHIHLDPKEQLLLAEMAAKVRYGDVVEGSLVTPENELHPGQLLRTHRSEDRSDDLWTKFNVIQENLLEKGGVVARGERRASPVKAITKKVDMNQMLWQLAEKFRELKTQG